MRSTTHETLGPLAACRIQTSLGSLLPGTPYILPSAQLMTVVNASETDPLGMYMMGGYTSPTSHFQVFGHAKGRFQPGGFQPRETNICRVVDPPTISSVACTLLHYGLQCCSYTRERKGHHVQSRSLPYQLHIHNCRDDRIRLHLYLHVATHIEVYPISHTQ